MLDFVARHRPAFRKWLWTSLGALLLVGLVGCESDGPTVTHFTSLPEHPPYAFAPPAQSLRGAVGVARTDQFNALIFDCDGDGDEDYVQAQEERVRRFQNRGERVVHDDSVPLEPGYGIDGRFPIHEPVDIDGDGRLEIAVSGPSPAGDHWRFWFLDTRAWRVKDTFDLPTPDGLRPDGKWDGSFAVQAVIDVPSDAGFRRALLISVTAGYDGAPRGVLAVDCVTHEVLWRCLAGPKVTHNNFVVHDFDGDGSPEIYYGCSGVGNVTVEQGHGYSDEWAMVFSLHTDGSRRWERRFARQPSSVAVFAADLDGDGKRELVICHGGDADEKASALEVLDPATGGPVAEWTCGSGLRRSQLMPRGGGTDVVVATTAKQLVRLEYRDGRILERARAGFERSIRLIACLDLIGDGQPQVFLRLGGDPILAVDGSLSRILAWRAPDDTFPGMGRLLPWTVFGRTRAMAVSTTESQFGPIALEPLAAPPPEGLIGFVSGAVAVFVLGSLLVWSWWRRHRRRGAPPDGLQPKRDLQLRLLDDLAAESHGRIGALKVTRSLVRLVRMNEAGHLTDVSRLGLRARDLGSHGWVRLDEILDRCEAADLPTDAVTEARSEFTKMREIVARLDAGGFSEADIAAEQGALQRAWERGEAAMMSIRADLEAQFSADLATSLDRVLELHTDSLDGTTVDTSGVDGFRLRIHRADLEWVLDGLTDNALRAMRRSSRRKLTVTARQVDGACHCIVTDTGGGMPAELIEKLGRERVTTRRGGGTGWLNSMAMLERYGAALRVVSSDAASGTQVCLFVPLATEPTPMGEADER